MHNPSRESVQSIYAGTGISASNGKRILALKELLGTIALQGYKFTTVTPVTHERFLLRSDGIAKNSRDIFGWSLPFKPEVLSPLVFELMLQADLLINSGDYWLSKIRISSLDNDLFLHSRFPTNHAQSVFFGPDTYRFARFIKQTLKTLQPQSDFAALHSPLKVLDVGCGSGAGGIAVIRSLSNQQTYELNLNDLNPIALDYAVVCAQVAAIPATILSGDFFNIQGVEFDLIVSNPPYISDSAARLYRDGGSHYGLELSLRIVIHALNLLTPGGRLLLYTGVAMTSDEKNPLLSELIPYLANNNFRWSYEEIDPDIFGEELEQPAYKGVSRIAAVGFIVVRIG